MKLTVATSLLHFLAATNTVNAFLRSITTTNAPDKPAGDSKGSTPSRNSSFPLRVVALNYTSWARDYRENFTCSNWLATCFMQPSLRLATTPSAAISKGPRPTQPHLLDTNTAAQIRFRRRKCRRPVAVGKSSGDELGLLAAHSNCHHPVLEFKPRNF